MRNFQEKRGLKTILQSKPALILLGIIILAFAWSIIGLARKAEDTAKNKKNAEDKIVELQKEQDKLSPIIQKLQTDQGKEAAIRENLGWGKPGEGLVVIVDDPSTTTTAEVKQNSFLDFFKNLFK
jgi:cell division protein FtsB